MAVVANEQHVMWEKRGENWVQNTSSGGRFDYSKWNYRKEV